MKSLQRHKGTKITIENDYHRPRSTAQTTQQIVKVIENRPSVELAKQSNNPSTSRNQRNPVELPVIDRDLIPRIVKDVSKDEDDQEIIKPVTKPPIVLPILPILSKDSNSSGSVPTPPTPTQQSTTTSAPKTREKPRETAPLVTNSESGQYQQPTPQQPNPVINQPNVEPVPNVAQATTPQPPPQMTFSSKFDKFKTLQDRQAKQEREQRQKKEESETKKKLEKKAQAKHKSSKPSQVHFIYNSIPQLVCFYKMLEYSSDCPLLRKAIYVLQTIFSLVNNNPKSDKPHLTVVTAVL